MAAALWRAEAACGVLVANTVKRNAGRVASFKSGADKGVWRVRSGGASTEAARLLDWAVARMAARAATATGTSTAMAD